MAEFGEVHAIPHLPGTESARTVLTGSRIDTVINGGKYDGALGVLAGLAALRALREQYGPPRKTLEVVAVRRRHRRVDGCHPMFSSASR